MHSGACRHTLSPARTSMYGRDRTSLAKFYFRDRVLNRMMSVVSAVGVLLLSMCQAERFVLNGSVASGVAADLQVKILCDYLAATYEVNDTPGV